MPAVLQALLQSRKAWVTLAAIAAVVVLALTHAITPIQALDTIKWLVSAWLGAQALEDAAAKRAGISPSAALPPPSAAPLAAPAGTPAP